MKAIKECELAEVVRHNKAVEMGEGTLTPKEKLACFRDFEEFQDEDWATNEAVCSIFLAAIAEYCSMWRSIKKNPVGHQSGKDP